MLDHIPNIISDSDNESIAKLPEKEEVKKIVFEFSGNSIAGPDGYTWSFFQWCWYIVAEDLVLVVLLSSVDKNFPGMSPYQPDVDSKIEILVSFSDLRPTSLSCFINKIISRVLHDRLVMVSQKIISQNQSEFVKGRSIIKNILLAQEIIRDINRRNKLINFVIKLDMTKAYDRVLWVYLTKVTRRFGFSKIIIDMVWRLISNSGYFVLINGQSYGLVQSPRDLKQGTPSPDLCL